jgi:chondroitin 4-sulfotransferase 11/chondroitin 4-sulfotransferase 13/dermatan 4-sulfotransferase 1
MRKFENFIFLADKKALFVYVPKVACTNWKCVMRYLSGYEDYLDAQLAHDRERGGLTYLSDLETADEIVRDPTINKYTFVRNPYTRVLSAYLNKIRPFEGTASPLGHKDHFKKVYQAVEDHRLESLTAETEPSLYSFLHWLAHSGHVFTENEHWAPQTKILQLPVDRYDFVGRFENIRTDAKRLLKELDCDIDFPSQKDIRFPPTEASRQIQQYFGRREKMLTEAIYSEDFVQLGYTTELPD